MFTKCWVLILFGLQAKHANGEHYFGVDGDTGKVTDMRTYGLLESASVKIQTLKTAIEVNALRHCACPCEADIVVFLL